MLVHVTLLPFINAAKELKTKPTQHSVKELQGMGIQPDILLCRTEMNIPEDQKTDRIELFMPYQVNKDLLSLAKPDAIFMNCLPATRGCEQTADVND